MTLPILMEQMPSILTDFPDIRLVYLFGSQVTGEVGPMSDYDLAIFPDGKQYDLAILTHFQYAISKLLDTSRVNVVVLSRAPIELAYQIIASGILLYQKDLYTRVEFEAQVLSLFGDYLPVLNIFKQQTLQGGPHGKRVQRYRDALERTQRTLGAARTPPGPASR
jgi:uncharacterized protein